jgi:hypothetical protein
VTISKPQQKERQEQTNRKTATHSAVTEKRQANSDNNAFAAAFANAKRR